MKQIKYETIQDKAMMILCPIHQNPIQILNITDKALQGERTMCLQCDTLNKSVLLFPQATKLINELWEKEQEQYQNLQDQQKNNLKDIIQCVEQIKQIIEKQINYFQKCLMNINIKIQESIQELKDTSKLYNFMQLLNSEQPLGRSNFEDLAIYLSDNHYGKDESNKLNKNKKCMNLIKQCSLYTQSFNSILKQNKDKYIKQITQQIDQIKQEDQVNNLQYQLNPNNKLNGHSQSVDGIVIFNNQQHMATCSQNNEILIWNISQKKLIKEIECNKYTKCLAISNDDTILASSGGRNQKGYEIQLWKLAELDYSQPINLIGHIGTVNQLQFFNYNSQSLLVSGSDDKTIRVWNNQHEIHQFNATSQINGISISSKSPFIACACNDGQVLIFSWADKKLLISWYADNKINALHFSPQSSLLLTAGHHTIKLWNMNSISADMAPIAELKNEDDSQDTEKVGIGKALFASNFSRIISVSDLDNSLTLWDVGKKTKIQQIEIPGGFWIQQSLDITKDLKYIMIGGDDNSVKMFTRIQ